MSNTMQWVKAVDKMPPYTENKKRLSIKYEGNPDVLIFLNRFWHWWGADGLHDIVHNDSWSAIEWLDEEAEPTPDLKEAFEKIANLEKIIELKEAERKEWADLCIRKQAEIEAMRFKGSVYSTGM